MYKLNIQKPFAFDPKLLSHFVIINTDINEVEVLIIDSCEFFFAQTILLNSENCRS